MTAARLPLLPAPLLALAACLCACGGGSASASASCPANASATPAPPSATAGPVTLAADRGLVPRGGQVALVADVTGPVDVNAPCDGPASLVVTGSDGVHVFSDTPAPQPGDPCGALTLAAGKVATFHLSWSVDPTLPSGSYALAVTVGDLPEVSVQVDVGGGVGGAPQC
jgi:hypothetical protein